LFAWEVLALAAATNLTAPHNHTTGLVLLLPPAVAILVEELQVQEPRSLVLAPTLAALLALPSVAILLVGVNIWVYVAAAWAVALGALALGLLAPHPQFSERHA
jgi:hypothetical protein